VRDQSTSQWKQFMHHAQPKLRPTACYSAFSGSICLPWWQPLCQHSLQPTCQACEGPQSLAAFQTETKTCNTNFARSEQPLPRHNQHPLTTVIRAAAGIQSQSHMLCCCPCCPCSCRCCHYCSCISCCLHAPLQRQLNACEICSYLPRFTC
jgi:hypothetical protein